MESRSIKFLDIVSHPLTIAGVPPHTPSNKSSGSIISILGLYVNTTTPSILILGAEKNKSEPGTRWSPEPSQLLALDSALPIV